LHIGSTIKGKDFGNLIRIVVCGLFGHGQHKQKEHQKGALYIGAANLAYILSLGDICKNNSP